MSIFVPVFHFERLIYIGTIHTYIYVNITMKTEDWDSNVHIQMFPIQRCIQLSVISIINSFCKVELLLFGYSNGCFQNENWSFIFSLYKKGCHKHCSRILIKAINAIKNGIA